MYRYHSTPTRIDLKKKIAAVQRNYRRRHEPFFINSSINKMRKTATGPDGDSHPIDLYGRGVALGLDQGTSKSLI